MAPTTPASAKVLAGVGAAAGGACGCATGGVTSWAIPCMAARGRGGAGGGASRMARCTGGGGGECTSCMQLAHSYAAYGPRAMSGPVPSKMSRAMPTTWPRCRAQELLLQCGQTDAPVFCYLLDIFLSRHHGTVAHGCRHLGY
eukprot:7381571-Prymnesium_polylepis.1